MTRPHPNLHIAREAPGVDLDAAERAAGDFLKALGVPPASSSSAPVSAAWS
jgi:hypothetical protein